MQIHFKLISILLINKTHFFLLLMRTISLPVYRMHWILNVTVPTGSTVLSVYFSNLLNTSFKPYFLSHYFFCPFIFTKTEAPIIYSFLFYFLKFLPSVCLSCIFWTYRAVDIVLSHLSYNFLLFSFKLSYIKFESTVNPITVLPFYYKPPTFIGNICFPTKQM